ncbi:MAG: two-component regulator propeller domain-containing protein, partial [Bacteroidota bacterium]
MRCIFGCIVLFLTSHLLWGQLPSFERALAEDQSLSGSVTCLLQDRLGFIWIGSTDGLFRYDGHELRPFYADKAMEHALKGNRIHDLNLTADGKVLVGTDRGISIYDPKLERFDNYQIGNEEGFGANTKALAVIEDSTGQIWYGSYQGLYQLDPATGRSTLASPKMDSTSLPFKNAVWELTSDREGRLWIGLNAGLAVYDPYQEKFLATQRPPYSAHPDAWRADQVFQVVEQSDGTIWLGTGHGLWRCTLSDGAFDFSFLPPDPEAENSLAGPHTQDMWVDHNDDIWVGTWANGISKVEYDAGCGDGYQITKYRADDTPSPGFSINKIMAIMEDRSGVLWMATGSSFYKYARSARKIAAHRAGETEGEGLTNPIIKSTLTDRKGNLWVGTLEGLNFLPAAKQGQQRQKWIHFKRVAGSQTKLRHNNIFGLLEDSKGVIWICTYGGLHYILPEDIGPDPIIRRLTTAAGLPANFIYSIMEESPGIYWVNTYAKLARMEFDPFSGQGPKVAIFDASPKDSTALVNATCYISEKDRYGQVWVGTYDGLGKVIQSGDSITFENYRNQIEDPTSLTSNTLTDLHLDQAGQLWAGTRMGLHRVVQKAADSAVQFQHFGRSDGFRNE